jgi:alpha-amylase
VYGDDVGVVAGYQSPTQDLDAALPHPMLSMIRLVFTYNTDANALRAVVDMVAAYDDAYLNVDVLRNFVENNDNVRWLSEMNPSSDVALFKSAIVFSMMSRGILISYYGAEQLFEEWTDPFNRAPLWTSKYSTTSDMYRWMAHLLAYRRHARVWATTDLRVQIADDSVLAFSRGTVLVALTNDASGGQQKRATTYGQSPYAAGMVMCNLFYQTTDCLTTLPGGVLHIVLNNGEAKVYDIRSEIRELDDKSGAHTTAAPKHPKLEMSSDNMHSLIVRMRHHCRHRERSRREECTTALVERHPFARVYASIHLHKMSRMHRVMLEMRVFEI